MDLKTRYVIKGIGKEQTIASIVTIQTSADGSKIEHVQDKWNGELPDSSIKNVSFQKAASPSWWIDYGIAWMFWIWSLVWWTKPWMVSGRLLNLNAD
jgi:hypothetical protein